MDFAELIAKLTPFAVAYAILAVWVSIISIISIIVCIYDKIASKTGKVSLRIPEKVLLGCSLLGGAVGGTAAMFCFRHKTKHWYFWVVNILGLVWQLAAVVFLLVQTL